MCNNFMDDLIDLFNFNRNCCACNHNLSETKGKLNYCNHNFSNCKNSNYYRYPYACGIKFIQGPKGEKGDKGENATIKTAKLFTDFRCINANSELPLLIDFNNYKNNEIRQYTDHKGIMVEKGTYIVEYQASISGMPGDITIGVTTNGKLKCQLNTYSTILKPNGKVNVSAKDIVEIKEPTIFHVKNLSSFPVNFDGFNMIVTKI